MAKRTPATRSDGRRAPSSRKAQGTRGKAKAGPSRRGKPPDDVVGKGGRTGAMPRGSEKAPPREPKAGPPSVPSSLNLNRRPSAARSGRAELKERYREHHETGPGITGGDVDADWESAYSVGDEAPGGDNPTPGQTTVEDVARSLGVEYEDAEELKAANKIESRDRHRWELDPASSEDYQERTKVERRRQKR